MRFQLLILLLHALFAPFAKALPQYSDSWSEPAFPSDVITIASAAKGPWDSATDFRDDRGSNNRNAVSVDSRNPMLDFSNLYLPTLQSPSSYKGSSVKLAQQPTAGPVFLCCPDVDTDSKEPVRLNCPASEFAE